MIVVDTNVIAYLCLPTAERTATAEHLWRRDDDWHVPLLWRSEFRNVLARRVRRGGLSMADAVAIASEMEARLEGREHLVPTREVLRLVAASACSAYDCEFVALAEQLAVPLITVDRALVHAFPAIARPLR